MNVYVLDKGKEDTNYVETLTTGGFTQENRINKENVTRISSTKASLLDHVLANKKITCYIKSMKKFILGCYWKNCTRFTEVVKFHDL